MARAAVNAKTKQKQGSAPPPRRPQRGRRRHAGGGNPNQDLFFVRLRRRQRWVFALLAVLFAATFAFLGVGSGQGGLDQLFSGLNIFGGGGGSSVAKAQKAVKKNPNDPTAYRKLATAYESKGDNAGAIDALQNLTRLKPKNAAAWTELAGLQMNQATDYLTQYQSAYANRQLVAPGQSLIGATGKLGTALGTNRVEETLAKSVDSTVADLQTKTQLAFNNAVTSYDQVTQITPKDANAWFNLAQAAQQAGSYPQAVRGYKQYLKLNPDSSSRQQIETLIKQLSPAAPSTPSKKKK